MGTHAKTLHKAGTITPGIGLSAYHGGLGSSPAGQAECVNAAHALQQFDIWRKEHPVPESGQPLEAWYEEFAVQAKQAAMLVELAESAGADAAAADHLRDALWTRPGNRAPDAQCVTA